MVAAQGAAKHCEEPVTGHQRILINAVAIEAGGKTRAENGPQNSAS